MLGSSTPNLRSLRKTLNMPAPIKFDMVFLDHLKPLYTVDLKVMEEEGLIGPVRRSPPPPTLIHIRPSLLSIACADDVPGNRDCSRQRC